ncbi:hypothetical protein Tco_0987657 [Tanacetum coccineum]
MRDPIDGTYLCGSILAAITKDLQMAKKGCLLLLRKSIGFLTRRDLLDLERIRTIRLRTFPRSIEMRRLRSGMIPRTVPGRPKINKTRQKARSYVNEKINFSDNYFQEIINPDFEKIDSPVPTVILEKIIFDLEDEVVSFLEKEKENLEIIESLKSKGFESSENANSELENQSKNDCQEVEKGYDNLENSKVIAPGMSDDKFSQMLNQLESQPEIGSGSGSGGRGDDEHGDDEDDGEDGEDEDDS